MNFFNLDEIILTANDFPKYHKIIDGLPKETIERIVGKLKVKRCNAKKFIGRFIGIHMTNNLSTEFFEVMMNFASKWCGKLFSVDIIFGNGTYSGLYADPIRNYSGPVTIIVDGKKTTLGYFHCPDVWKYKFVHRDILCAPSIYRWVCIS